ncbi:uncharacterized protein V6R79_000932 [Siganus canaliculatus]
MVPQCFVAGTAPLIHLKGEVGGNVTFHCRSAKDRTVKFLYFQKGDIFVNGYHATKEVNNTWNNTRVDRNASTVHMENLNISHADHNLCLTLQERQSKRYNQLIKKKIPLKCSTGRHGSHGFKLT